jgi:hypothetical protein
MTESRELEIKRDQDWIGLRKVPPVFGGGE